MMLSLANKGSKLPRRAHKDSARLRLVATGSPERAGSVLRRSTFKSATSGRKDEQLRSLDSTTPRHPTSRGVRSEPDRVGKSSFSTPRTPAVPRRARPVPAKQGLVTTPHAVHAFQQRRYGPRTPGRDRRKSGRLQRETPRNALRNLSRILAPVSKKRTSPDGADPLANDIENLLDEDSEDELDAARPRPSINIAEADEDDSFNALPPLLSTQLDEEDVITQRPVEALRRAHIERPHGSLLRGSLGSTRLSDRFIDVDDLQSSEGPVLNGSATWTRSGLTQNDFGADVDLGPIGESRDDDEAHLLDPKINRQQEILSDGEIAFAFDVPTIHEPIRSPSARNDQQYEQPEDSREENRNRESDVAPDHDKKILLRKRKPKPQKLSRLGIPYYSMPTGVVKRVAILHASRTDLKKARIKKEALGAVMQASDWFLEQVGDDLGTYAKHAGRKTIDDSDVTTLMKRQRQINAHMTVFSLAEKHLPRELLQGLRMPLPNISRSRKRKREAVSDCDEDDSEED